MLDAMRYVFQFGIPATLFAVVVYLLLRRRGAGAGADDEAENTNDTATFLLILVIGAVVAVLSLFAVEQYWA